MRAYLSVECYVMYTSVDYKYQFQCCAIIIYNENAISLKNCVHRNTCVDWNFQEQNKDKDKEKKNGGNKMKNHKNFDYKLKLRYME